MINLKSIIKIILFASIIVLSINLATIFGDKNPVVSSEADGYSRSYRKPGWQLLPGKASDIGVGLRGHVFCIGTESTYYGGCVYRWDESNFQWMKISGLLTRITVDMNGKPWGFNNLGRIYKGNGYGAWSQVPTTGLPSGKLTDIAIGGNPGNEQLYVIGPSSKYGGHAYKFDWRNGVWEQVGGVYDYLTRITVSAFGFPWAMNGKLRIVYQGNGDEWFPVNGYPICDIAAGEDNNIYMLGSAYHPSYGAIVRKYDDSQEPIPWVNVQPMGLAVNIDVSKSGEPWVANLEGQIWRHINN